jgi:hypothetical protein
MGRLRSPLTRRALLLIASAVVVGTTVRWRIGRDLETRAPVPVLRDLQSLEAFRAQFNADRGKTRLVLLMSPT